jgi:hypothetical protein
MGSVKETARAKGLATLRGNVQRFIEDQATKLGVGNIKQLNQTVSLTRMFGDALKAQEIGAGGNAAVKLSDYIVGSLVGGGVLAKSSDVSLKNTLSAAGIGLSAVLLKRILSPENTIKLANALSRSLSEGEAGNILKFLQGDRSMILSATERSGLKNAIESLAK